MSAGRTPLPSGRPIAAPLAPVLPLPSSISLHIVAPLAGETLMPDTGPLVEIKKLPVLHGAGSAVLALRPDSTLSLGNLKRDDKHKEAAFAQERGVVNNPACVQCTYLQNTGVWVVCVSLPGFFGKACCNCRWANETTHCSAHEHNMGLITESMQRREGISARMINLAISQAPQNLQDWLTWIPTVSQESYYHHFGKKICLEALRRTQPENAIFQAWVPAAHEFVEMDYSLPHRLNPFYKAREIRRKATTDGYSVAKQYEIAAEGPELTTMLRSERKTYLRFLQGNYLFRSLLPEHQKDVRNELREILDKKYTEAVKYALGDLEIELEDSLRLPADPDFPPLPCLTSTSADCLRLYNRGIWGLADE
ncbi:hypothetical protein ACEPPN_007263 [Leptodophora sp. 'Broadleaf-Isolate-01']